MVSFLLLGFIFLYKHCCALLQNFKLTFKIIFILKHGVVNTGTDQNKYQRRQYVIGNTDFCFKTFCLLGVAFVYTLKKLFAVFNIFRMSIYLIHQPVFFAVLFRRPIRDLIYKAHQFVTAVRRSGHKVIFDLCHAVGGGFYDKLIKIFEIDIKGSRCAAALLGKRFDPCAGQAVFGIAFKAFFHDFFFSVIMLLFCSHRYLWVPIPPKIIN